MNTLTPQEQHLNEAVHLAQIDVIAGNPEANVASMVAIINSTPKWELIVFPEMCISWYMLWDDWTKDSLVKDYAYYNHDILDALEKNQNSAIWGNIEIDENKKNNDGSIRKYNAAYIAENGKLLGIKRKILLPNYRMFDDKRYFTSWEELALEEWDDISECCKPVEMNIRWVKQQVSALICEDIWNINSDYRIDPVELVKEYKPDLLAVVSTSPYGRDKAQFRDKLLQDRSRGTTLAYVNPIGTQNIGKNIHAMDGWSSMYVDWEFIRWIRDYTNNQVISSLEHKDETQQAHETITYTLRNFWESLGKPKIIIGLSGWIDSGAVATLLADSIWSENIIAVNMPSKFNSKLTKDLAQELATKLWIPEEQYLIYPIQDSVDQRVKEITEITGEKPSGFELENIQARIRGQILSDLSAKYKWVHTNNGNKDETALWYATLYGDVSWAISPIWDLHKYQVSELARYMNSLRWEEIIPVKMIDMKPSAELSHAQNPEEWGGDPFHYEFVWKTIKALGEQRLTDADLLRWYINWEFNEKTGLSEDIDDIFNTPEEFMAEIEMIWKKIKLAYFKRVQAPPIITVNKASFWFDFREAQNAPAMSRSYKKLKGDFLAQ